MKYLKSYESMSHDEMMKLKYGEDYDRLLEVIQDVFDICLDIKDEGYTTTIGFTPLTYALSNDKPEVMISIHRPSMRITGVPKTRRNYKLENQTYHRIISYLEGENLKFKVGLLAITNMDKVSTDDTIIHIKVRNITNS